MVNIVATSGYLAVNVQYDMRHIIVSHEKEQSHYFFSLSLTRHVVGSAYRVIAPITYHRLRKLSSPGNSLSKVIKLTFSLPHLNN